jgi:hypothetical protein
MKKTELWNLTILFKNRKLIFRLSSLAMHLDEGIVQY